MTVNLCKCLKCGNTLIEENPQSGEEEFNLTGNELNMILIKEEEDSYFWGCPICKTDENLIDI